MRFSYETAPLAAGGEKTVHRGLCLDNNTPVVIKFLRKPYTDAERERFRLEILRMQRAKVGAGAGVATILEHDLSHDPPWYAEEYFPEGTLAKKMNDIFAQGKVFVEGAAVGYCRQILLVLHDIHRTNQIHRDVKPANILIDGKRMVITDMGIGRTLDRPTMLQTQAFCGTLAYAAPEQSTHGAIDHRADLYAVGVILHEMLTGQRGAWNNCTYSGNQQIRALLLTLLAFRRDQRPQTAEFAAQIIASWGIATR